MESEEKKKSIKKITAWGLFTNLFLALVKFMIGFLGNSQAVIADGVHSLSDISSDVIILLGVRFWLQPPDKNHPYGHYKIESFITLLIGLILIFAAVSIGYHAITSFDERPMQKLSWFVLIAPIISIILKEIIFRYTNKIGKKTSSTSVQANAWHHRSDVFSSVPVLIAVFASTISDKLYFLDNIGAIVVAGYIIKVAAEFIINSISELTDTGISEKEINRIKSIVKHVKGAKSAHRVRSRKIGDSVFIDLHLEVDGNYSVFRGHDISEKVKSALIEKMKSVIDVVVHIEPQQENDGAE
ncbi:MAG: cation transporter [Candidatus Cloacimonetes bacterium]|nr:cation transporter [Candidatus Cloacimonadota bacterium]